MRAVNPELQIVGPCRATRGPAGVGSRVLTSVIVPAYNEVEGVAAVLAELCPLLDDSFEVVVVDDGSTDGTAEVARSYPCQLVRSETNEGKGAAMGLGFEVASGEHIIVIDADHTYPASAVVTIAAQLARFDLVAGARASARQHIPTSHRFGNALLRALLRHLYGQRRADPLTGVYGIRRRALDGLALRSRGFGIETEIAIKGAYTGLRSREIPIAYRPRVGRTKLRTVSDGAAICRTILGLVVASRPRAALLAVGLPCCLIGCLLGAVALGESGTAMAAASLLVLGPLVVGVVTIARRTAGYPPAADPAGVPLAGEESEV